MINNSVTQLRQSLAALNKSFSQIRIKRLLTYFQAFHISNRIIRFIKQQLIYGMKILARNNMQNLISHWLLIRMPF